MAPFAYPVDLRSAEKALFHFSDFATRIDFQNVFQEAVYILYGRDYEIKMDLNKRMNFFCTGCNKTMNSVQALTGHNNSAQHLKNMDRISAEYYSQPGPSTSSLASRYSPDSLQYQIVRSNIRILGVHLIEAYTTHLKSHHIYYKCILCGAHGKREAIYKHLIGDKHTDRYIKFSVQINAPSLVPEQRNALRIKLAERDGIEVDKIRTIVGRDLFPYKWEQEGLPKRVLLSRFKHGSRSPDRSDYCGGSSLLSFTQPRSRSRSTDRSAQGSSSPSFSPSRHFKREPDSCYPTHKSDQLLAQVSAATMPPTTKQEPFETPGGVIIQRDNSVAKRDQEVQVFTYWTLERCLMKLNFINHTQDLKSSQVVSQQDAKECLELMFSVGNLLSFTVQKIIDNHASTEHQERLKEVKTKLQKMAGTVVCLMAKRWDSDNPGENCLDEVMKDWAIVRSSGQ